ncbi:MAG: nitroreductase family protein [Endomicrobiaceae bacterium]|nr:nitroreductase family protein [Endomicrobiaceae bacterium]
MNEAIKNIKMRRSVRFFEQKKIEKEILQEIIEAGNLAPTGMNAQPWRFVVVESSEFKEKLAKLALPKYKQWLERMSAEFKEMRKEIDLKVKDPAYYDAPAVIFVIGKGMTRDLDCPMVCQNIMLAARSMGIGSCWVFIGQLVLDNPEIRKEFDLQEDEKVFGPIVLGYPKEGFPEMPLKKEPSVKWL